MKDQANGHISESLAQRVYLENVRDNQIGGLTDGISPEVAEDIGYFPPESYQEPNIQSGLEATNNPPETEINNVRGLHTVEDADETAIEERKKTRARHPSAGTQARHRSAGRGKVFDGELDTDLTPHYHKPPEAPLTDEEKMQGARRLRAAIEIVRLAKPPQS